MPETDIRIKEVEAYFSDEYPRARYKFGDRVAGKITFAHVRVRVENRKGQVADGWGAILLSHYWAYRSSNVDQDSKDQLMRRVTSAYCERLSEYREYAHPIDIFHELQLEIQSINEQTCEAMHLDDVMPYLGALVCASPLDAAVHDAFGIVNGVLSYNALGPKWVKHDLSAYLGDEFRGRYLSEFIKSEFNPSIAVWHVVGGLDQLRRNGQQSNDQVDDQPQSLEEWIDRDGVYCFKTKPSGKNLALDLERTREIYHVAKERLTIRGQNSVYLSLDANEQCEDPSYMVELLRRLYESDPKLFNSILYLEQPVGRDIAHDRHDMRELAAIKPVLLDESLTSLADMQQGLNLGWSGIALKTCKCHSLNLLLLAKAQATGIPYTVQDLTNPGIALVHSVGLAARMKPLLGIETNARQYYPDISQPEARVHPGIVQATDGKLWTQSLQGPGLGYRLSEIDRDIFRQSLSDL